MLSVRFCTGSPDSWKFFQNHIDFKSECLYNVLKYQFLIGKVYKKLNMEYIPIKLKTTRYEMYTEKDGELVALWEKFIWIVYPNTTE